jgi:4-hydroxybenzoate polyprenyltransferase
MGVRQSNWRRTVGGYVELVRVPNLFTAPPDVILGAALAGALGGEVPVVALAGVGVASMLLYAGGTSLNDVFDAKRDAVERPARPIPSGRVSRRPASVFGASLLGGGVLLASLVAGLTAAVVATAIALGIVLYDGVLKGTVPGNLTMGGIRGLNVVLGTTVAVGTGSVRGWALVVPVVLTGYIAAVTYLADRETGETDRSRVRVAVAGVAVATFAVPLVLLTTATGGGHVVGGAVFVAIFVVWAGPPLVRAHRTPTPSHVGPAIGSCILGLVLLDAAFAAVYGLEWSLLTASFFVPALGLSKVVDVT